MVSNVSITRHFESAVDTSAAANAPSSSGTATKAKKSADSKKMLQLCENQFSSSVLCFTFHVALACVGIELFEFTCRTNRLEVNYEP